MERLTHRRRNSIYTASNYGEIIQKLADYEDEAERRQRGCEFCYDKIYAKHIRYTMPVLAPMTRTEELRQELLQLTGEEFIEIPRLFCHICGKCLKG